MIFIANVLVMNGGTTFLIRMSRELQRRGQKCAVLLLSDRSDPALERELSRYATILRLSDFLLDRGSLARGLLGVFAPLARRRLGAALSSYGTHLHAMSIFGLICGLRLASTYPSLRLTVGVYHQNEFLYRPPPFYFARRSLRLFAAIPPENVIFFNESSRDNYTRHFVGRGYGRATLLPIGVELDRPPEPPPARLGQRIVSIGNLVGFKTYNRHIIELVTSLKDHFPEIRYDIYGTGPTHADLAKLAEALGVSDRVTLHGAIDYARIREVVAGCDLFVGSGTALIEAAAVGRPALIGIESIQEPETYGFLSDARGYSYNENVSDVPKQPIASLVTNLFSDPRQWRLVAEACAAKAHEFSIKVTASGFAAAGADAHVIPTRLRAAELGWMATSAIAMRIAERFGWSNSFGDRRDQSY